jgi:hypothetical protein
LFFSLVGEQQGVVTGLVSAASGGVLLSIPFFPLPRMVLVRVTAAKQRL